MFFEPRLGKSKAALDAVGLWALAGRVSRVLILAPRIAIPVWEDQIEEHYPFDYRCETYDDEWWGEIYERTHLPQGETQFFLAGREETFRRVRSKRGYDRPKQDVLLRWRPQAIILDESHEYKRPGGVGAQDCWRLVRNLRKYASKRNAGKRNGQPWVILLSGTPNPKGWVDLFAPFRIMDETIFGTNAQSFKDKHVIYGSGRRKWTILGYRKEKEIVRKVRAHSYSIGAEEAGMANVTSWQKLPVRLPEHAIRMYLEMAEEFLVEWDGGIIDAKNAGVKRLRLLQITGGFTTDGGQIHLAKVEALASYARLLREQGESVVVYSRFTPEVEAVTEALARVGFDTHRVDGTVSDKDRRTAIRRLARRPDNPCALSFQYQAGSRAIELVGAAEVVYYGLPDGWVDFRQTMARVLGPNQKRPVRYTAIVAPGTVDISVLHILRRKGDLHDFLMRNPRQFLFGEVDNGT